MAFPIQLRSRADVPAVVEGYASRTFASRLAKFAEHIIRASINFEDEAGPRGMEKVCRVKIMLKDQEPILFEVRASALREALERAVDGAERAVRRAVERVQELGVARPRARGRSTAKKAARKPAARKKTAAPGKRAPAKPRPARKPARKSAAVSKPKTKPTRRTTRAVRAPKARAQPARAGGAGERR